MKIYSEELKKIKLIDVFEIVISGEWGEENLKDNENTAYIIRTTNFLNNGTLDIENRELVKRQISSEKIDEKHLKRGDIIIEKSGGSPNQPVGRVVYFDIESEKNFLCNNFTSVLRVKEGIEPKYIFYFLKDCYKKRIVLKYQNKTTGIINLKLQDYLKNTEIQLPNIEIQKKIVAILDKAFLINSLLVEKERKILELNKSIFVKLKLKNKNWDIKSFAEVTKVSQGLQIPISKRKKENGENRFKYITIQFLNGSKEVEYIENPRENVICSKEDILMTRTGNTGMVVTGVSGVFHNNFFIVKYDKNILLKEYLVAYLNSKEVQEEIKKRAGTSTIPDLNHGEFYKIKILIPPITFQEKFSEQIQVIAKSKIEIQKSIEETQKLFDSLMEKYFG